MRIKEMLAVVFDGLLGIGIRILTLGNMCGVYGSFWTEAYWRHPGIFTA